MTRGSRGDLWSSATEAANLQQPAGKHQGREHPASLASGLDDIHPVGAPKGQPKRELINEVYKLSCRIQGAETRNGECI